MESFTIIATKELEEKMKEKFRGKIAIERIKPFGTKEDILCAQKSASEVKVFIEMLEVADEVLDNHLMREVKEFALRNGGAVRIA